MKIIVFGASGFVGRAVIERLKTRSDIELIAAINSDGNAWSLAKDTAINIKQVNILDKSSLKNALEGVTHVVNCTRGADNVMTTGFKNLVDASVAAGVKQFVHLSSVLIYGERPVGAARTESAVPNPQNNLYGKLKLLQDNYLQKSVSNGFKANIICPPNIIGPGSYFLDGLLGMLKNNSFVLLENGGFACATVDVNNVAKAIELALFSGDGSGSRYFVTDAQDVCWRDIVDELRSIAKFDEIYSTNKSELEQRTKVAPVSMNPLKSLKHLVSSDVREALRKDPVLCKVDLFFRGLVAKLPGSMEDKIRLSVEGHMKIKKVDPLHHVNWNFCASQLRNVSHSCEKIQKELGYVPEYSFNQSMKAYRTHYRYLRGLDTSFSELLKFL